jgi:hypothetical protein
MGPEGVLNLSLAGREAAPMAKWVTRARTDGGENIQIKWRLEGRWQGETFTDVRLAAEFRTAVELAGQRWPEGWVRGYGWQQPDPEPPRVRLDDVATGPEGYFAQQGEAGEAGQGQGVHRARRTCRSRQACTAGPKVPGQVQVLGSSAGTAAGASLGSGLRLRTPRLA